MLQEGNHRSAYDLLILGILATVTLLLPPLSGIIDPTLYPKMFSWSLFNISLLFYLKSRSISIHINGLAALLGSFLFFQSFGLINSANIGIGILTLAATAQTMVTGIAIVSILNTHADLKIRVFEFLTIILFVLLVWASVEWILALESLTLTHQGTYGVKTSLGHRNLLAHFILLLTPFTLPLIQKHSKHRQLLFAILMWSIILSIATLSRGAWALIPPLIIAVIWMQLTGQFISKKLALRFGIGVIALAFFILYLMLDNLYTIQHQFSTAFSLENGSTRDRLLLAKRSIQLFTESPLFGIGLGDWPVDVMKFNQGGMATSSGLTFYQRAHNDLLQVFAESGLLAGLAYLLLIISGLFVSIKRFIRTKTTSNLSILLAWLFFTWISLTNFPKERVEFLIVLAMLTAITPMRSIHLKDGKAALSVGIVLTIICASVFSVRLWSEYHFNQAIESRLNADWNGYYMKLKEAKSVFLTFDDTSHPIDWHMGLAQAQLGNQDIAREYFEEALTKNPYHPETHYNLAVMSWVRGEIDDAFIQVNSSIKYAPSFQKARILQAAIYDKLDDRKKAFDVWLKADPNTITEEYKMLGTKLSIDSLGQMLDFYPERRMKLSVMAFRNTPNWAFDVIHKAAKNRLSFPTQVAVESCYYMFDNCEDSECVEVEQLKTKYIPDIDLNLPDKPHHN